MKPHRVHSWHSLTGRPASSARQPLSMNGGGGGGGGGEGGGGGAPTMPPPAAPEPTAPGKIGEGGASGGGGAPGRGGCSGPGGAGSGDVGGTLGGGGTAGGEGGEMRVSQRGPPKPARQLHTPSPESPSEQLMLPSALVSVPLASQGTSPAPPLHAWQVLL